MKKVFENAVWWSGVIMVGLILGLSLQFVRAWTEPTVDPPSGNVGAPINTGSQAQTKSGDLTSNGTITANKFCLGSSCITSWPSVSLGSLYCDGKWASDTHSDWVLYWDCYHH